MVNNGFSLDKHVVDEQNKVKARDESLPLIVELLLGQSKYGVMCMFEPEEYSKKSIKDIVYNAVKRDYDVEDKEYVRKINECLNKNGEIFYNGKNVYDKKPLDYASVEQTSIGEKFLYLPINIISPNEGGYSSK